MATLNEIPLSFLQEHSYILHISGRGDYDFRYGKESLFPVDFNGTIGDFLDSDISCKHKTLCNKILKEKLDHGRELKIRDFIIDLYEATNCELPFKIFRCFSDFPKQHLPEVYKSAHLDSYSLAKVFNIVDKDTKALMGINLIVNDQYHNCKVFREFKKIRKDDNFLSQLRQFIKCFVNYKRAGNVRKCNDLPAEIFDRKFRFSQWDSVTPTTPEMAEEFNRTIEAVRLNILKSIEECRSMLTGNGLDLILPASFNARLAELTKLITSRKITKKQDICKLFANDLDDKTLAFIEKLFDLQYFEAGVFEPAYVNSKVTLDKLRKSIQMWHDYFSDNPLGVTRRVINREFYKKIPSECQEILSDFIEISDCFTKNTVDEDTVYFIKWQYIKNTSERIARILYESQNKEMRFKELVTVYNEKASRSKVEIKPINSEVRANRSDLIQYIGKTGVWKLTPPSYSENNDITGASELIKLFLGTLNDDFEFDLNDLKAYLHERNITYYSDNSLGTIINTLGYKKKVRGGSVYVQNNIKLWINRELIEAVATCLNETSDKRFTKTELKNQIELKYSRKVNYGTLSMAINKASELFKTEKIGNKVYVSLVNDDIQNFDFSIYDVENDSPAYHNAIIQTAIDELLRTDSKTMVMSELKEIVEKYVPSDIHSNIIYKLFTNNEIFVKTGTKPKKISLDMKLYRKNYVNNSSLYNSNNAGSRDAGSKIEFGFEWAELKEMIISNFGETLSSYNQETKHGILDRMYDIMRGSNPSLYPDNQFWKALEMLNRLYKYPTSCYERELLSTKLILGIENYISNLLYLKGYTQCEDGLSHKIGECQYRGCLPARFKEHKINKSIGKIISIRNRYSHTNNEKYHGDSDIYETMGLSMKFYIMVAEYDWNLSTTKNNNN